MAILYKLFHLDTDKREDVVTATSILGIITNLLIAAMKMIVGVIVSSIAIISEGANNASDCATSLLTLVGTKLAGRRPTKKHPFGFGRIEYLTSLIISVLILLTAFELLKSSVELIFHPAEMTTSVVAIVLIAVSAVIKLLLGSYSIKMGKKVESESLVAVGEDSRNDSIISAITIVSVLIFIIFGFSVDAYAGIITSLFVFKAGFEILRETVSHLLGKPEDPQLASTLYKEIRSTKGVINAVDMVLHNYGPDRYHGSVNIEVEHDKTVGEIYEIIHALQLRIMHEYGVVMVFGMYAVDNDQPYVRELRNNVASFVRGYEHVVSYHAVYLNPEKPEIYCDLIVDYDLKDWDKLREDFISFMKEKYPDHETILTIETEYV